MKRIAWALARATAVCIVAALTFALGSAAEESSPIFGVKIPAGYRQWELVAPASGEQNGIRSILGNAVAMKAYRDGTLPFPDGAMLAELVWARVPSPEASNALAPEQVFVPGKAVLVQFMVKDSKRYAATGGWGFGRFIDGVPADTEQHKACFECHGGFAKDNDFVFTRSAP